MKKRIVAMFLAVCFIVTLLPTAAFAANETRGICGANGDNVTWELTQNNDDSATPSYTLTISGSGAMENFVNKNSAPMNNIVTSEGAAKTTIQLHGIGQKTVF